jgi:hypothetical protein
MHAPSPTVVFLVTVPPLGTSTYFIQKAGEVEISQPAPVVSTPLVLDNGILKAEFDASGMLMSLTKGGVSVKVAQNLKYYHASDGSAGPNNPHMKAGAGGSGNYIFRKFTSSPSWIN